jgi:hypothetical protein
VRRRADRRRVVLVTAAGQDGERWRVRLICCGRDDGEYIADSWESADQFREVYTSGAGVNERGYSAHPSEYGHRRAGIVERLHPATGQDGERLVTDEMAAQFKRDVPYWTSHMLDAFEPIARAAVADVERRTLDRCADELRAAVRQLPSALLNQWQIETLLVRSLATRWSSSGRAPAGTAQRPVSPPSGEEPGALPRAAALGGTDDTSISGRAPADERPAECPDCGDWENHDGRRGQCPGRPLDPEV